jgi:hypothetical protein
LSQKDEGIAAGDGRGRFWRRNILGVRYYFCERRVKMAGKKAIIQMNEIP